MADSVTAHALFAWKLYFIEQGGCLWYLGSSRVLDMGESQLMFWYDHLYVTGPVSSWADHSSDYTRARLYYRGASDKSPQRDNMGFAPSHKITRTTRTSSSGKASNLRISSLYPINEHRHVCVSTGAGGVRLPAAVMRRFSASLGNLIGTLPIVGYS